MSYEKSILQLKTLEIKLKLVELAQNQTIVALTAAKVGTEEAELAAVKMNELLDVARDEAEKYL